MLPSAVEIRFGGLFKTKEHFIRHESYERENSSDVHDNDGAIPILLGVDCTLSKVCLGRGGVVVQDIETFTSY